MMYCMLVGGGVKLTYLELAHYYVDITQMKMMMMMTATPMIQLLYIDSHPSESSMSNLVVSETLTLMMKSV